SLHLGRGCRELAMTRTKAFVATGVAALVFVACSVEDPNSLLGGGRSGRIAGGGGGAGEDDGSGGTLLATGATRDEALRRVQRDRRGHGADVRDVSRGRHHERPRVADR